MLLSDLFEVGREGWASKVQTGDRQYLSGPQGKDDHTKDGVCGSCHASQAVSIRLVKRAKESIRIPIKKLRYSTDSSVVL
jgi:hypothetical protein